MMKPIEIIDADLGTMKDFELSWRWTEEGHTLLSKPELDRIRPFGSKDPRKLDPLWEHLAPSDCMALNEQLYSDIEHLREPEGDSASRWLLERHPETRTPVVVAWASWGAVLTDTELFAKYWDSFCYASSDDVVISPLDLSWMLTYFHQEVMCFGRMK